MSEDDNADVPDRHHMFLRQSFKQNKSCVKLKNKYVSYIFLTLNQKVRMHTCAVCTKVADAQSENCTLCIKICLFTRTNLLHIGIALCIHQFVKVSSMNSSEL